MGGRGKDENSNPMRVNTPDMEYPYSGAAEETFLMRQDRMEWFQRHPRRTRNTFIMHGVSGSAKIRRNMDVFDFGENMEWTLLPDSVIRILEPTDDFRVHYCVCPPPLFDEVTMHLPSAFLDFVAEERPYPLATDRDTEANRCAFGLMQVIYDDTGNAYRHQIIVNVIQSFYLAFYDRMRDRIGEREKMYVSAGDRLVKRFWGLLLEHYREHRSVQWYAGQLCVSERHLSQTFRTLSDTTPKQTIDDYMVLEIKIQLRSTHDTVQQIADRLNFSDQSVMGRFFKGKTGMSPQEYRCRRQ